MPVAYCCLGEREPLLDPPPELQSPAWRLVWYGECAQSGFSHHQIMHVTTQSSSFRGLSMQPKASAFQQKLPNLTLMFSAQCAKTILDLFGGLPQQSEGGKCWLLHSDRWDRQGRDRCLTKTSYHTEGYLKGTGIAVGGSIYSVVLIGLSRVCQEDTSIKIPP